MHLTPGKHVNVALRSARNHVLAAGVADPRHLIAGTLHRSRDVTAVVETISTSSTGLRGHSSRLSTGTAVDWVTSNRSRSMERA